MQVPETLEQRQGLAPGGHQRTGAPRAHQGALGSGRLSQLGSEGPSALLTSEGSQLEAPQGDDFPSRGTSRAYRTNSGDKGCPSPRAGSWPKTLGT